MDNLRFYEAARDVPPEARKEIGSGRLKGKTDINPMWRIKKMTEIYGPCGLGWWYIIKEERIIDDEATKQRACFVDIDLFYKDPVSGDISQPIPGTGGSSFVAQERNGPYLSDECFKMALTDALSVSMKAIGIGADVYWEQDKTKNTPDYIPAGGSAEAAQEVGKKKLEELNAQVKEAPKNATTGPATAEQKQTIKDEASDEDYVHITQKYGVKLERLSKNGAEKVIAQIRDNNAKAAG